MRNEFTFHCPSVGSAKTANFGYAFNSKLGGVNMNDLKSPNSTQMVYDSSNLGRNAHDAVTSLPTPARHLRKNHIGFADGRVRSLVEGNGLLE